MNGPLPSKAVCMDHYRFVTTTRYNQCCEKKQTRNGYYKCWIKPAPGFCFGCNHCTRVSSSVYRTSVTKISADNPYQEVTGSSICRIRFAPDIILNDNRNCTRHLHTYVTIRTTMFSFHKPKTYRSLAGCCICRAKSSSSRFTDSARYEADFEKCFNIDEQRHGEICNACVLLVKRWKKLPKDSLRNWEHVSTPALSLVHRLAPQLTACKKVHLHSLSGRPSDGRAGAVLAAAVNG